jgi:hypothetical protein
MGAYLFSLIVNKSIVFTLFWLSLAALEDFGNWLFGPLQSNPQGELIVVMVVCPWFLTTIQFLIFDAILKADPEEDAQADDQEIAETYNALDPEKSALVSS